MNNSYKNHTLEEFYKTAMIEINYNVRKETATDRISRVKNHITPYLGAIKIKDLTALKLERWQINLHRSRGADQAKRCKHLLKRILNRAIVHEIINSNPIEAIATIREPHLDQREIYTKEEVQTILNGSRGQLRLFILTMVSLGARSGETIALKFSDINWRNRTIKIQRSMRKGEIKKTKTNTSRSVDIPINLFIEFEKHQINNPYLEFIFVNKKGTPYKDSAYLLRRHFKPLLEHLGIEYKSLYSLRHTFATLQLQGGQNISYVAKQLGHSNTQTTQEFYIKYLKDDEDLKKSDEILNFN